MVEVLILSAVWVALLGYIAAVSEETMQMTWLIGLALMVLLGVLSPLIGTFVPAFR